MLRRLTILAFITAATSIPLQSAHAGCDVTPYIGASVPTKSLILSSSGSGAILRNSTYTVYGLGISHSMSERFGLELVLGAGTGNIEIVSSGALQLASTLLMADVRGKYRIVGGDDAHIGLVAGVGYTQQKVGLFDYAQTNDLGDFKAKLTGIYGLSFDSRLSDQLNLSMEMVDRIREQGAELTGLTGVKAPTQHDITITAGLSFPLMK